MTLNLQKGCRWNSHDYLSLIFGLELLQTEFPTCGSLWQCVQDLLRHFYKTNKPCFRHINVVAENFQDCCLHLYENAEKPIYFLEGIFCSQICSNYFRCHLYNFNDLVSELYVVGRHFSYTLIKPFLKQFDFFCKNQNGKAGGAVKRKT